MTWLVSSFKLVSCKNYKEEKTINYKEEWVKH